MRIPFVVGRLTRKTAELVVVRKDSQRPFPGPWSLRALVRPATRRPA